MIFNSGTDKTKELRENKEDKSNKVSTLGSESTNTQYPGAKVVYDSLQERALQTDVGDLSDLPTTDKSSIVGAISELNENKVDKKYTDSTSVSSLESIKNYLTGLVSTMAQNSSCNFLLDFSVVVEPFAGGGRQYGTLIKQFDTYFSAICYSYSSPPVYITNFNGTWNFQRLVKESNSIFGGRTKHLRLQLTDAESILTLMGDNNDIDFVSVDNRADISISGTNFGNHQTFLGRFDGVGVGRWGYVLVLGIGHIAFGYRESQQTNWYVIH